MTTWPEVPAENEIAGAGQFEVVAIAGVIGNTPKAKESVKPAVNIKRFGI